MAKKAGNKRAAGSALPPGLRLRRLQSEYASLGGRLRMAAAGGAAQLRELVGLLAQRKAVAHDMADAARRMPDVCPPIIHFGPRFDVPLRFGKLRLFDRLPARVPCAALSGVAAVARQQDFSSGPGAIAQTDQLTSFWWAKLGCHLPPSTEGYTHADMASLYCFEFPAPGCGSTLEYSFDVSGTAFVRFTPSETGSIIIYPQAEWALGAGVFADLDNAFATGFPSPDQFEPAIEELTGKHDLDEDRNMNLQVALPQRAVEGSFPVARNMPTRLFVSLYARVVALTADVEMREEENYLVLSGPPAAGGVSGVGYETIPAG